MWATGPTCAMMRANLNSMSLFSVSRIPLLTLVLALSSPFFPNQASAKPDSPPVGTNADQTAITHFAFKPGPLDGKIAFVTAGLLEQIHYSKQPFDRAVSSKFFDRYIE